MNYLTGKDQEILQFIKDYKNQRGIAPSLREIGEKCFVSSTSMVASSLRRLQDAGKITRYRGVPRGIKINDNA